MITLKTINLLNILFLMACACTAQADSVMLNTKTLSSQTSIQSWKTLRDKNVVKQDLDYSCGAASIATVLTAYYQRPTTEKEILELLTSVTGKKGAASFSDMQKILPLIGFKGLGLATSWENLQSLKIPVLVYVSHRKQDHFAILSGINNNYARLADPSLGNRVLTRGQFKSIWETRKQQGLEGKMLAIIPINSNKLVNNNFFTEPQHSKLSERLLLQNR